MTRPIDDQLREIAAVGGPVLATAPLEAWVYLAMARELLAARRVVKAAKAWNYYESEGDGPYGSALEDTLIAYDREFCASAGEGEAK